MKVLKKGTGQQGWSVEGTCTGAGNGNGGCGAELLVEQPDLFTTHSSHYDGSNESYITFMCPCCTVLTDISEGIVPSYVVAKLPTKAAWLAAKAQENTQQ